MNLFMVKIDKGRQGIKKNESFTANPPPTRGPKVIDTCQHEKDNSRNFCQTSESFAKSVNLIRCLNNAVGMCFLFMLAFSRPVRKFAHSAYLRPIGLV